MRSMEERLIEYRDAMISMSEQTVEMANRLEEAGFEVTPLRDGARFQSLVAEDLTKILIGEELPHFAVVVDDPRL